MVFHGAQSGLTCALAVNAQCQLSSKEEGRHCMAMNMEQADQHLNFACAALHMLDSVVANGIELWRAEHGAGMAPPSIVILHGTHVAHALGVSGPVGIVPPDTIPVGVAPRGSVLVRFPHLACLGRACSGGNPFWLYSFVGKFCDGLKAVLSELLPRELSDEEWREIKDICPILQIHSVEVAWYLAKKGSWGSESLLDLLISAVGAGQRDKLISDAIPSAVAWAAEEYPDALTLGELLRQISSAGGKVRILAPGWVMCRAPRSGKSTPFFRL
jgi:hypothetical protein